MTEEEKTAIRERADALLSRLDELPSLPGETPHLHEAVRADVYALLARLDALQESHDIFHRTAFAQVDKLVRKNRVLREIVDGLANEARYSSQSGEGSSAYLARLVQRAKAALDETR